MRYTCMSLKDRAGERSRARALAGKIRPLAKGRRPGLEEERTLRQSAEQLGIPWPPPPATAADFQKLLDDLANFAAAGGSR
jgi:hypothetical protein